MRIALAQMGSVPGDFPATVERMLQVAERAHLRGAELVVFPSTLLSGAYPIGLCDQRAYQADLLAAVESFAVRTPVLSAVPAYVSDADAGYTEVFLCGEGCACPLRRRETYLPDASFDSCADAPATCTVGGVGVRFLAGDVGISSGSSSPDVVVALAPLPFCCEDTSTLGVYGIASGALAPLVEGGDGWFALVQGVGAYDDVVLAGGSFVAAPDSTVAAACPLFEEDLAVCDVSTVSVWDADGGAAVDRVPGTLVGMALDEIETPSEPTRTGLLYRALMVAVRDYVRKSGFSDVAVGLSGGIDSSLVAAIAADALGAEHVLGVLMPGPFSSESSVVDARGLAEALGMRTKTVPIGTAFEAFRQTFAAAGEPLEGLALENLQARLRGTVLMSIANARNLLVLNTGNKSEAGMGYSTLYGDTVGAYSPLTDVYKGTVYRLASWRNGQGPVPVIPENVLSKPPSAELSENQTDEASLGAPYGTIDHILEMHVERSLDATDIVAAGIDRPTVERVLSACAAAEYKRRQEPMGPIVSLRPFVDRGWPVVHGWRDRADDSAAGGARPACACPACVDGAQAEALERPGVDDMLDGMLAKAARQDQVMGMLGDVAFGAMVSGRGADMDDCFGLPLFSKN